MIDISDKDRYFTYWITEINGGMEYGSKGFCKLVAGESLEEYKKEIQLSERHGIDEEKVEEIGFDAYYQSLIDDGTIEIKYSKSWVWSDDTVCELPNNFKEIDKDTFDVLLSAW